MKSNIKDGIPVKDEILVSIIMPTLNAESVIEDTLKSIRNQSVDQKKIEILVIDGGSTDRTREIALKYNADILENPEVVPEAAKRIGMVNAKGKYFCLLDSDIRFTDITQLEKRMNFFADNPEVKAMLPDITLAPESSPDLTTYFVVYGDPFSYFIYRINISNLYHSIKKIYNIEKRVNGHVVKFQDDDILPLADAGSTMVDWEYAHNNFQNEIGTQQFVSTFFERIVGKSECMGIVDLDRVVHYAQTNKQSFFKKLKFRVINNIHYVEGSGYTARAVSAMRLNRRKFLFPAYCLSIVWPFLDSVILSIRHHKKGMLMHFVFTYYVFFQIIGQYALKILKKQPKINVYGR